MRRSTARLSLPLAALLLLAQLVLAWHAPSHIDLDGGPSHLVSVTDCEICLPGHGPAPAAQPAPEVPAGEGFISPVVAALQLPGDITVPGAGPRAPPALS